MDCQNCTYEKLDSMDTDPEVYKREDDLKLLIDPLTPLFDKIPYPYPSSQPAKKTKKKKRVLSTLDILISIFIVTPCVVGCWRGIWQILDIYAVYFPAWESFSIGMATHIVLALGQDVFHQVVVEKEPKHPILRVFALLVMKFYTTTFNVINNMVWRAGWILFDRYCGLQSSDSGIALLEGSSSAIWFTIVCILILFCLKGLKNTMSPPFSIALDSKDEVFLFSTRYIYKATYCAVVIFLNDTQTPVEISRQTAEKLVSSPSMQIENFQKHAPRPFGTETLGPPPQQFTPTTPTPKPITIKAPPTNYPQLSNYRNNLQPKNIQEILAYINRPGSKDMDISDTSKERQATTQEGFKQTLDSSGFASADPFYPYKPSDPSEINLLATASFRFAPPIWKNFRKLYQQQTQQSTKHITLPHTQQVDTSNIQETIRNFAKPFVVNLNIIPMEDQYPSAYSRYGQRVFSHRIQGGTPYKYQGDPRARFTGEKMNRITIRLNVFPETLAPLLGHDDNVADSSVNKVRFV